MSQNKSPTTNRVCKYFQQQEKFADMETRERKTENLVIRNGINQLISYLPPKVMQCPAPAVKKEVSAWSINGSEWMYAQHSSPTPPVTVDPGILEQKLWSSTCSWICHGPKLTPLISHFYNTHLSHVNRSVTPCKHFPNIKSKFKIINVHPIQLSCGVMFCFCLLLCEFMWRGVGSRRAAGWPLWEKTRQKKMLPGSSTIKLVSPLWKHIEEQEKTPGCRKMKEKKVRKKQCEPPNQWRSMRRCSRDRGRHTHCDLWREQLHKPWRNCSPCRTHTGAFPEAQ